MPQFVKVRYGLFTDCSFEYVEQLGCFGSDDFLMPRGFQVFWEGHSEVFGNFIGRYEKKTLKMSKVREFRRATDYIDTYLQLIEPCFPNFLIICVEK